MNELAAGFALVAFLCFYLLSLTWHIQHGTFQRLEASLQSESNMITSEIFSDLALSFQGTECKPHFERRGFAVTGRRMFATYLAKDNTANVFLSPEEQTVFCEIDSANIYPVANKWGEKGATTFVLNKVQKEILLEALLSAYNNVVKRKK